ncbi:putative integral membrane protein (Pth11) [Aspergillus homomorphus CBS 101889]|uniref:Integral membrane protein n=1 Tax=Aspergillus homomorphus (strain CBS 101889) TaxID=1450537 RepID=A0A395IBI2_ASPHC|nr:integral membrane protein [Aspergillus homomorphus CBS 101889]RAL17381.1 integral membrane protein [Aspergillus homomorphus CBS 101889]
MTWVHNLERPDPHSHVPRVIAICLTFSISAVLAVVLRLYIRWHTKRPIWVDDYAAACSAVLGMAYAGIAVGQTRYGLGLDAAYFPDANVVMFSKIQYAGGPTYILALLGFKVSLLTSYLRIGGFVAAYRWTIIAVVLAVVCNQLVFTFLLTLACKPIAKQWDTSLPGTCIDTVASYYGTSLGLDIVIIALPLPVLWSLQLRRPQKIALIVIFALGFFVTIIQIIRIFSIRNLKTYTDSQPIVLWSDVEISLGVIIACIPTYGPYFHSFASTLSSGYTSRRRKRTAGGHPSQSRTLENNHHPHSYRLSGLRRTHRHQSQMIPSETDEQDGFPATTGVRRQQQQQQQQPWENVGGAVTTTIGRGSGDGSSIESAGGREHERSQVVGDIRREEEREGHLQIQKVMEVEVRVE